MKDEKFIKNLLDTAPHIMMEAIGGQYLWYVYGPFWCVRKNGNRDETPDFTQKEGETFPDFVKRVSSVLMSMNKIDKETYQARILNSIKRLMFTNK